LEVVITRSPDSAPALKPPPAVIEITRDLERAGYAAWCVGGAVRDALLGHAHLDWDLATDATPDQVRAVFGRRRTVPVGIAFGTVGVLDADGILHEVTTFRRDVRTDGRHAEVEFGASLDEDLARRDFTVNAIAFSPASGVLHDPFGGRADIERGIIRAVGDPPSRMQEDRLRALRGIRFAARFGFEIDGATWAAIKASAPHLTRLSAERVKQEIEKTMDQVRKPSTAFTQWRESGAMAVLLPELMDTTNEVWPALDWAAAPGPLRRPARRLIRILVLFSDLSGPQVLRTAMRLRFSRHDAQWLASLVDAWRKLDAPISDKLAGGSVRQEDVRRWIATVGRLDLGAFYRLAMARWHARAGRSAEAAAPAVRAVQRLYRRSLRSALAEPVDLRDLAVDGDDLRGAGIAPGPMLGKILSVLLDAVIADPGLNTRERLLSLAREAAARMGNPE
jgi:tRNA nucleotidyltransferase (CCA-adding enzyme)